MTDVYFSFDTEDFTNPDAWDAQRDIAALLHRLGVKGNFNVVGQVAYEWMKNGRTDVTDEIRNHTVSSHTRWHSAHPSVCEYTDVADWDEARRRTVEEENESMELVKKAVGVDKLKAFCPPGNTYSYVPMYTYPEQGMPLYLGSFENSPDGSVFYCGNGIHTNYDYALEGLFLDERSRRVCPDGHYDLNLLLDDIATYRRIILYAHPTRVYFKDFWDLVNFKGGNKHEMYEWDEPPRYTAEERAKYFARFEELIKALQADDRFAIRDLDYLEAETLKTKNDRVVTKDQLPEILRQLKAKICYLNFPVKLSVADCFAAAKHFLDSDDPFRPGTVYGFLEAPRGTDCALSLTAAEVRRLARNVDLTTFLPPCFSASGKTVGPADLLIAMLEVALGAEKVVLTPRDQQCDLSEFPHLRDLHLAGTWTYDVNFKDEYISDRLRWQAWTLWKE